MPSYGVTIGSDRYDVAFEADGSVLVNGRRMAVDICRLGEHVFSVIMNGTSIRLVVAGSDGLYDALLDAIPAHIAVESERARLLKRFTRGTAATVGRTEIRAPMPALVVKVEAAAGERVEQGRGLLVLEAMKMENELRAPRGATVREVCTAPGATVEKGTLLMVLE
jgi:biotin carboxyl carrier protein